MVAKVHNSLGRSGGGGRGERGVDNSREEGEGEGAGVLLFHCKGAIWVCATPKGVVFRSESCS